MRYAIYEPTPPGAASYLKKYLENKVVYDLGAGYGEFAAEMYKYAKRVVAVESDPHIAIQYPWKGIECIENDFMQVDLKEAEVIFVFLSFVGMYALTRKLIKDNWHGIVISHYYSLQNLDTRPMPPSEVIVAEIDGGAIPFLIYKL